MLAEWTSEILSPSQGQQHEALLGSGMSGSAGSLSSGMAWYSRHTGRAKVSIRPGFRTMDAPMINSADGMSGVVSLSCDIDVTEILDHVSTQADQGAIDAS